MGALIGNACGSYTDKSSRQFQPHHLYLAMQMPGGGFHGAAPGQVSADGEMTVCLLRGLVESDS